tara:strand:+ start:1544 stop:3496 length:1953 start_codon:yes stop_codon:yes gene_type:complete
MDNITPQEFAKQMGAYPNAPYNPIPVGGYMDEGFNWVMGAESFNADWQTNDKFWEMLHEEHEYLFDEDGMVTIPHKQLAELAKEMGFEAESFNAAYTKAYQIQMGDRFSCGCNIGYAEQPYHDMGNLYAHCATCGVPREIYPANHRMYAESLSEIEGPTAEASTGGLHSPSSFDITWEDGTGQSSASMPPNEIHFGGEEGYDFQKMTPSPYTPFDQIGNELQQQRMESGPMLEPTNANFSAESRPISEDGELLAIYDDMGEHKGFIEMEDDLEDDSIEIDITDDEMNDIAEVRLDSEVVGNPSPSSPLEEVPATVPSPAEPTNSNFAAEKKTDYITMILGTAALVVGSGMFAKSQGWLVTDTKAADTDDLPSIDPTVNDGLVASPSTGDLLPADYEEMVVESTGYAVPIIPISLDPSFMGSRFQALPTDRLVDSNEPGIGAHTDVAMYRDTLYREPEQSMVQAPSLNAEGECNCSILDKIMAFFKGEECSCETEVKESQGVGQTPYFGFGFERKNPQQRVIKETGPISLDPSVTSYLPQNLSGYTGQAYRPPTIYGDMMGLGMAGASVPFVNPNESTVGANRYGSNPVDSSTLQSIHGNLSSSTNASYTNGSKTMSLAQWSIDYDVSQTSDSEAFAVSRSSGIRTMIRRV